MIETRRENRAVRRLWWLFPVVRKSAGAFFRCSVQNWFNKGVLALLVIVLVAVMASFAMVLLQTWREYDHAANRSAQLEAEVAALKEAQRYKERYLRLMLEDPEFVERVVREKLGYVRPNETVFFFDGRGR
jgi:cell division protein FtsB